MPVNAAHQGLITEFILQNVIVNAECIEDLIERPLGTHFRRQLFEKTANAFGPDFAAILLVIIYQAKLELSSGCRLDWNSLKQEQLITSLAPPASLSDSRFRQIFQAQNLINRQPLGNLAAAAKNSGLLIAAFLFLAKIRFSIGQYCHCRQWQLAAERVRQSSAYGGDF